MEAILKEDLLKIMNENMEAMKTAKGNGWADCLTNNDPFDCIIETYEDLISIINNLPSIHDNSHSPEIPK